MVRAKDRIPSKAQSTERHGLAALALCLLVLAAYANSFRSGLIFDNKPILLDDPRIRVATSANIDAIWSKGYWYGNEDPTLYRPLTTLSYLFNYAVLGNGADPAGYHWINLLLHAVNALLVYRLGLVFFRRLAPALTLAALWAVHPVLTESVTNVVGRADLLSGFGVLAGLMCHIRASGAAGNRRFAWLAGLAAASAIGVFSKESAVVLIAVMLLYDVLFRPASWRVLAAGYGSAALPVAVYLLIRAEVLAKLPAAAISFISNPLIGGSFWSARLTATGVIGRYLMLLVWPANLSADYSYNQIPLFRGSFASWPDWIPVVSLMVCVAAVGIAVVCYRRNRAAAFFIGLFFLALAPVANIALRIATIMAERFLYLPAVGFLGCFVIALHFAADRMGWRGTTAAWIAGLLCLVLLVRTHYRNDDWESERTLWSSTAAASPASARAHSSLAAQYYPGGGNVDLAIEEADRSMQILRGLPPQFEDVLPFANAGNFYRAKGDQVAKGPAADSALRAAEWYQKSLALFLRGVEVDRARGGIPANRLLYQDLGQTYLRLDRPQDALQSLDYGLSIEPVPELFELISRAHAAEHDSTGAAIALLQGVLLYPDQKGFASELLDVYGGMKPPTCAVQRTGSSAGLNLDCPLLHEHLCAAAAKLRELDIRRGQAGEAEKMRILAAQSLGCPAR